MTSRRENFWVVIISILAAAIVAFGLYCGYKAATTGELGWAIACIVILATAGCIASNA